MSQAERKHPLAKVHEADAAYIRQRLDKGMTRQEAQVHVSTLMVRQQQWGETFGGAKSWPCAEVLPRLQALATPEAVGAAKAPTQGAPAPEGTDSAAAEGDGKARKK